MGEDLVRDLQVAPAGEAGLVDETALADDTAGVHTVDRTAHLAGAEGALLRADEVVAGYVPGVDILNGTDFYAAEGELVGIIGPNGAGKSTLVKAIAGLVQVRSGTVSLDGNEITNAPTHRLVAGGLGYVPQTDNVFQRLTVEENLEVGMFLRPKRFRERFERVAELFPTLATRRRQRAGSLSGGERQMVGMARALMMEPRVLLLDEPSAGLSPILQDEVFFQAKQVNTAGVTVVMVEQNARRCLQICHRGYVLDQGRNAHTAPGEQLIDDPKVVELYLGTLAQVQ